MFRSQFSRKYLAHILFTLSHITSKSDIEERADKLMDAFSHLGGVHGINCRLNIEYGKGTKFSQQNRPCYGLKIKGHDLLLSELWREIIAAGIQIPSLYSENSDRAW